MAFWHPFLTVRKERKKARSPALRSHSIRFRNKSGIFLRPLYFSAELGHSSQFVQKKRERKGSKERKKRKVANATTSARALCCPIETSSLHKTRWGFSATLEREKKVKVMDGSYGGGLGAKGPNSSGSLSPWNITQFL